MLCTYLEKKTPTASLQILYNQLPSQLDIMYVHHQDIHKMQAYLSKTNHWDGIAEYASANSHLKTIKSLCHEIHHEGTPSWPIFIATSWWIPYYSWNPPVCTSLTAVGMNDTDDYQINLVDNETGITRWWKPIPTGIYVGYDMCNRNGIAVSLHGDHGQHVCIPNWLIWWCWTPHVVEWKCCSLHGDHSQHVSIQTTECRHPPDAAAAAAAEAAVAAVAAVATQTIIPPVAEFHNGDLVPPNLIPSSISKIYPKKTLDQYENNYRLFSQRLKKWWRTKTFLSEL